MHIWERKKTCLFGYSSSGMAKVARMEGTNLSQGVQEILIKAVALAVLTYTMSCFKFQSTFCEKLERMMAKLWWGQQKDKRRIHWMGSKKL